MTARTLNYILPKDILPTIPVETLTLFNLNYWEVVGEFITVYCYAQDWDDINGFFENWLFDLTEDDTPPDLENLYLEHSVSLMEIYGDFNEILGRVLHFLRGLPPHWEVASTELNTLLNGDLALRVDFNYVDDPDDAFSPDITSPTANAGSNMFNPNAPRLHHFSVL